MTESQYGLQQSDGPPAPWRRDASAVAYALGHLVGSAEPSVVFSSLARLCVPAFSDTLLTDSAAFDLLRTASQNSNRKLVEVAEDVVATGWLESLTRGVVAGRPPGRRE